MHHVMFDIDGTLVESFKFDEECYLDAVFQTLGQKMDNDWSKYPHISDAGILDHHLEKRGQFHNREAAHKKVKAAFIQNIKAHLRHSPVQQVDGAAQFISYLRKQKNVTLSIATGGWAKTAILKLESAGIDATEIPMASSNDHHSRTEIMKRAMKKAGISSGHKLTYFGDSIWDKKACEELQFNFVLVGNRVEHSQVINNFASVDRACRFIGL